MSYQLVPSVTIAIGCKRMSISEWDAVFASIGENYDAACQRFAKSELGSLDQAKRIRANYLAIRAYLVSLGHHTETPCSP